MIFVWEEPHTLANPISFLAYISLVDPSYNWKVGTLSLCIHMRSKGGKRIERTTREEQEAK